jgi:hypothetical protein
MHGLWMHNTQLTIHDRVGLAKVSMCVSFFVDLGIQLSGRSHSNEKSCCRRIDQLCLGPEVYLGYQ